VFGFRLVLLADADHECISGLGTGDLECLYAYVSVGSGEGRRGDTYAEDSGGFGQVHGVFALDWFLPVVFHGGGCGRSGGDGAGGAGDGLFGKGRVLR